MAKQPKRLTRAEKIRLGHVKPKVTLPKLPPKTEKAK